MTDRDEFWTDELDAGREPRGDGVWLGIVSGGKEAHASLTRDEARAFAAWLAPSDEAAALLAQALANNPIDRKLIERAYALLKGLETT